MLGCYTRAARDEAVQYESVVIGNTVVDWEVLAYR